MSVFSEYKMSDIRNKSVKLTGFLEEMLISRFSDKPFDIITPAIAESRGAQLSLLFKPGLMEPIFEALAKNAITVDDRKPNVIRVSPAPLYNKYTEVWEFIEVLRELVDNLRVE